MLGLFVPLVQQNLSSSSVAPSTNPDLLTALIVYLNATASVTSLLSVGYGQGGFGQLGYGGPAVVYDEIADPSARPPFLMVDNYLDAAPGDTLEDNNITLSINCVTSDLDSARTLGQAVKNAVDSISINDHSLLRAPFAWVKGSELGVLRNKSQPRRVPGIGKGGGYVYLEEIDYEFLVTPNQ